MGSFRCPDCQAIVEAPSPDGLVCPRCGYGGVPNMGAGRPAVPGQPPMYQATQPLQTAGIMQGNGPVCPRCFSRHTQQGGIPTWAMVCAFALLPVLCVFSLLFLIVKDESTCYNCGMRWKS